MSFDLIVTLDRSNSWCAFVLFLVKAQNYQALKFFDTVNSKHDLPTKTYYMGQGLSLIDAIKKGDVDFEKLLQTHSQKKIDVNLVDAEGRVTARLIQFSYNCVDCTALGMRKWY